VNQIKFDQLNSMLECMSDDQVEHEAIAAWLRFCDDDGEPLLRDGNKPTTTDFVIMHSWACRLWVTQYNSRPDVEQKEATCGPRNRPE
jgi:hypothetical protein